MKKLLISLMFVLLFLVGSCSEKSKMTGLCEKGDELACRWVEKNNLCKGGEGGNPGACTWLNNRKECENGSKTHCFDFAVSLYNERMLDLSKEYFLKSLLQYSQEEREGIFTAFLEENKVNFRVENLMYFWDVGCDAGLGYHCSKLFDILKERGLSSDYARMINLAEKGCSANFCQSCLDLGHIYGDGKRGVPEDMKKALEFYKKGCDSCSERVDKDGFMWNVKVFSCEMAGLLYFKGEKFGIPKNIEQSLKYYKIGYGIDAKGDKDIEKQRQVILNQMIAVTCGNGVIDEGEICDGGAKKCSEISSVYLSDTAQCKKDCKGWDIKGCEKNCSDPDKFCFTNENLKWSILYDPLSWDDAETHCKNLGGRLPTISEMRLLVRNCPAIEPGGSCHVTEDCSISSCGMSCKGCPAAADGRYSKLGDTDWLWTSTFASGSNRRWAVNFNNGEVYDFDKNKDNRLHVRCVSGALTENKFENIKNEPSAELEKTSEVPSPSFDCKKAATFVEKTICGNVTLADHDRELAQEYKAILKNPEKKTEVRDSQRNWIKERNTCKDEECLINSYKKRLGDLKGMR